MPQDLKNLVVRILDAEGETIGSGFFVAHDLVVTCAHVLEAIGVGPGLVARMSFSGSVAKPIEGVVEPGYWKGSKDNGLDVAFIRVGTEHVRLYHSEFARLGASSFAATNVHELRTFGFPQLTVEYSENHAVGRISGTVNRGGVDVIQFESTSIFRGMSGAPILDIETDLVVGMLVEYLIDKEQPLASSALRYAVPSDALAEICPEIRLISPLPVSGQNFGRLQGLVAQYAEEVEDQYRQYWTQFVSPEQTESSPDIPQPALQRFKLVREGRPFTGSTFGPMPVDTNRLSATSSEEAVPAHSQSEKSTNEAGENRRRAPSSFDSLEATFNEIVIGQNYTGVVVVAEPGAGKTLALHYFAAQQAQKLINGIRTAIPIYLPLNQYSGQPIGEFIADVLASDNALPFHVEVARRLEEIAKFLPLVLLLDGYNEIGDSGSRDELNGKPERLLSSLRHFIAENVTGMCTYIITSRPLTAGYDKDVCHLQLEQLDDAGILQCVTIFAPDQVADLYAEFKAKPALREMMSTPFRVKAIADTFRFGRGRDRVRSIPESHGPLFQSLVSTLVAREEQKWVESGKEWIPFAEWEHDICSLAYRLTLHGTTTIRIAEMENEPTQAIDLAVGAGLLYRTSTDVRFTHQQLQEYFAARQLQNTLQEEGFIQGLIDQVASQPSWDQPLMMLTGIVGREFLDRLIVEIAKSDPHLAASCVGTRPYDVDARVRVWLIEYLTKGTHAILITPLYKKYMRALGDMRCVESLDRLRNFDVTDVPSKVLGDFLDSLVKHNSMEAVQYLVDWIDNLARNDRRSQVLPSLIEALTRFTTPEVADRLARMLFDVRISDDVLRVVTKQKTPAIVDALRSFTRRRTNEVAEIAATLGITEIVPELLLYAREPEAITSLVKLGAGQLLIDNYVSFQRHRSACKTWIDDFALHVSFPIEYDVRPYRVEFCIAQWYWYSHYIGKHAADAYILLLVNCLKNATSAEARVTAAVSLACLRRYEILPLLEGADWVAGAAGIDDSREDSKKDEDKYQKLLRQLEAPIHTYLAFPRPVGYSRNWRNKFIAIFRYTIEQQLPLDSTSGSLVTIPDDQLVEIAYAEIRTAISTKRADYLLQRKVDALSFLVAIGSPNLGNALFEWLMQSIASSSVPSEAVQLWEFPWKLAQLIVEYGRQDSEKYTAVLGKVAPMVHAPDYLTVTVALSIVARLDGFQFAVEWLYLLSDRTWQSAYAVVDALSRMTVEKSVVERLVAQLDSPLADRRYFAVLALGNLKQKEHLQRLLQLADDRDENVQWALLVAISAMGHVSPEVVQLLRTAVKSDCPRIRAKGVSVIGELGIVELRQSARSLLRDWNLRVVEAAVVSTGLLADVAAVPVLKQILADFSAVTWGYETSSIWSLRLEYKLVERVLQALGRIGAGVDAAQIGEVLPDRSEWKQLRALALGVLMQQQSEDSSTLHTLIRPLDAFHISREQTNVESSSNLDDLSLEELLEIAGSAPDPVARERAVLKLARHDSDDTEAETILGLARDPSPAVRLAAKTSLLKFGYYEYHYYEGDLKIDLRLAQVASIENPSKVLNIPQRQNSDEQPFDYALQLVRMFPERYNTDDLVDLFLQQLAEGTIDRTLVETLCAILPQNLTHDVTDGLRQLRLATGPWGQVRVPPVVGLVQRDHLGVVPDMLRLLSTGEPEAIKFAVLCLANLGVYQATEPLHVAWKNLVRKENLERDDFVLTNAVAISMFDLLQTEHPGIVQEHSTSLRNHNGREADYGWSTRGLDYLLMNSLTNLDSIDATRLWAHLVFQDMYDKDKNVVCRGLMRWGLQALYCLFEKYPKDTNPLRGLPEHLLLPETSRSKIPLWECASTVIADCPDERFVPWLFDPAWGVRSIALHILAGRRSPVLLDHLEALLHDPDIQIITSLFQLELGDFLPSLGRALRGACNTTSPEFAIDISESEGRLAQAGTDAIKRLIAEGDTRFGIQLVLHYELTQTTPELQVVVRTGHEQIAAMAMQVLTYLHDSSSVDLVLERLNAPGVIPEVPEGSIFSDTNFGLGA